MATQTPLTLQNLRLLDFGILEEAFKAELARCVNDCEDRPGEEKARVVSIDFKLTPLSANPSKKDCDNVALEVEISSSQPKRRSKVYTTTPRLNGTLVFNPDVPDDPDQPTLYDSQERKDDRRKG